MNKDINKRDIDYIEYLIRKGEKQVELLKSTECDSIGSININKNH